MMNSQLALMTTGKTNRPVDALCFIRYRNRTYNRLDLHDTVAIRSFKVYNIQTSLLPWVKIIIRLFMHRNRGCG